MSKMILLTGATGFVGRQILQAIATQNTSMVRLVVREGGDLSIDLSVNIDGIIVTPILG